MPKNQTLLTLLLLASLFIPSHAQAAHGISIDGKLKYPQGFKQFDYVSDNAVKGGALSLHSLGSFDKMNPFTIKGDAPDGLDLLVFETLAAPSLDEPFAEYGLLAKDIELAPDRLSVTFTLDERAKFSDGTPVTAEDVRFSLETLKSETVTPHYQAYYQDITRAEVLDGRKVRLHFARKNRELHMIAGQLPILSKKFYTETPFDAPSLKPPVGSGPYVVEKVEAGKNIVYRKNPDYWAVDHPARRGMFNFETITIKYFQDQVVSLEAFKAGEFDFMSIYIAKQWARDLNGPRFESGDLRKETLPHSNNAGMQGFVMNTRRALFSDRKVRRALGLAFDFEWTNASLFFDQYTPCTSYFSNSVYAAKGLPQGKELDLLTPFRDKLPAEVFTAPPAAVSTSPPGSLRDNLREAKNLLSEVGWTVKDGTLVNAKGEPFEFEILIYEQTWARVMEPYVNNLKKLGIKVSYRQVDLALYTRRMQTHDFDMVVTTFGQSQSPGNEQRNYWHSSTAGREGSNNHAGINDPVVDHLVDKIIYAETQEDLEAACRALDRLLWYGYYVVPNWYIPYHRIAYRAGFGRPSTLPLYYSPIQALMTWWLEKK